MSQHVSHTGPAPAVGAVAEIGRLTTHQRRLFDVLAEHPQGLTVRELAELLNAHANTVRGHLDSLEERGLVRSTVRPAAGRGRPSRLHQVRAASPATAGEYMVSIVNSLVSGLSADDEGAAERLGRAWGDSLVAAGRFELHPSNPRRALEVFLARMGSDPHIGPAGELELHHCPFMQADQPLPRTLCAFHRGAVEALVEAMAGPEAGVEMRAGTGDWCRVSLRGGKVNGDGG